MIRHENPEIGNLLFNLQSEHGYLELQAYAGTESLIQSIEVRFCSRFDRAELNDLGSYVFAPHAIGGHDGRFYFHPHAAYSGIDAVRGIRDSLNDLIAFYESGCAEVAA